MKPIRLDEEAQEELAAAQEWYESQFRGLGNDLVAAIDAVLQRIQKNPTRFALVLPRRSGVRRVVLQGFPFTTIYMEFPEEIRVLAVAHHRRRPGYWRGRARGNLSH